MTLLIVSTLLKIAFVLAILLGIAPVLVWVERRQSSMIQDRVGPVRAGVPLPKGLADFIRGPMAWGAKGVAYLALGVGALSIVALALVYGGRGMTMDSLDRVDAAEGPARAAAVEAAREDIVTSWWVGGEVGPRAFLLDRGPDRVDTLRYEVRAAYDAHIQFYGWILFLCLVVAAVHFAASWVVKHSVDERNELTVFGLIHPAVDSLKMFWKEDFVPPKADKFLYSIAPIVALVPALATFAVIPFGPTLLWGPEDDSLRYLFEVVQPTPEVIEAARVIPLQVANINVGILYIFAIAGTGIVGAAIAGYSSDNKYSLLGGLRAASQMVSYEVTLGLTLVGCFMVYGSLLLSDMVAWQQEHVWGFVVQPLALILFYFAAMAEMKRVPFDAPEGESEIVAGYFLEYSGFKFGMFMTGEFLEHLVSGALIATLFFGGYDVPFLEADGFHFDFIGMHVPMWHSAVVLVGILAFVLKMGVFVFLFMQTRWTLPRFRYDQIMQLCWKIILPLSLANILITGVVILMLG